MEITGNKLQALHQALLSAFPTRSSLEMLLAFELSWNLDEIAGDGPMSQVVFELLRWAIARGQSEQLVQAAWRANPNSPKLKEFASQVLVAATPSPSPVVSHRREELVDLIVQLPVAETFLGRSQLLDGIPATEFNRSDGNKRLDVALIVAQTSNLGPLGTGARPLEVLIDNALRYAVLGSPVAEQLQAVKRDVSQSQ